MNERRPIDAVGDFWEDICQDVASAYDDCSLKRFENALSFSIQQGQQTSAIIIELDQQRVISTQGEPSFTYHHYENRSLLFERTKSLLTQTLQQGNS